MSRFFGVIVLAFVLVLLAVPVPLQAQHRGGFHGGPTSTFNAHPAVARPGSAFVGRPVAPFVDSPVMPFTGGIVTPFVGRRVTPPVITTPSPFAFGSRRVFRSRPEFFAPAFGYGYGYYSPYWPAPIVGEPAYSQPAYVVPPQTPAVSQTEADLSYQVGRLSQEIKDLRQQQLQAQRPAQLAPPEPSIPVLLIFHDGHQLEIQNYAIIGQTLWVLDERNRTKIPLSDLDLSATERENRARGVRFSAPSTK